MGRRFLVVVLAAGAVLGFASAAHRLAHHRFERHDAFERHVADLCAEAAIRASAKANANAPAAPPQ